LLDENVETASGKILIGTMHLAKGLEFRAVAVMACDDEVIPLQERIETVADDADQHVDGDPIMPTTMSQSRHQETSAPTLSPTGVRGDWIE
jgi:superfamily I DNA/RNA helicase